MSRVYVCVNVMERQAKRKRKMANEQRRRLKTETPDYIVGEIQTIHSRRCRLSSQLERSFSFQDS